MTQWTDEQVVRARRLVALPAGDLAVFLGDIRNQLSLAGCTRLVSHVDADTASASRAELTVRAPGTVRVSARVPQTTGPADVVVDLAAGGRAQARIRWSLVPLRAATGVELAIEAVRDGALSGTFATLGGRRGLECILSDVLDALCDVARLAANAAEERPASGSAEG